MYMYIYVTMHTHWYVKNTFYDSTSGVCAGMCPLKWMTCMYVYGICAFSLYAGGPHAFVVVPDGVSILKNTSPPTEMDGACFSG